MLHSSLAHIQHYKCKNNADRLRFVVHVCIVVYAHSIAVVLCPISDAM